LSSVFVTGGVGRLPSRKPAAAFGAGPGAGRLGELMYTCQRCGASLPPSTDQCAYCGTVSEPARRALQAEAARRLHAAAPLVAQQAIARTVAQANVERAANRTLLWGVLALFFMCLPVPSVLAVLSHHRTKRLARDGGVELPTRAQAGYLLGLVSALGFAVFLVWVCVTVYQNDKQVAARKVELQKIIAAKGTTRALDHDFACALAENAILSEGFGGSTDTGAFRDLQCQGAVRVKGDRAEMPDFKLRTSATGAKLSAFTCFKYGNAWFVERLSPSDCELD